MINNLSVQQKAFRNTSVGLLSFIISLLQTVISVPILLSYWGNNTYAIWLSLFAGYALLQSIDNGHINYIGNELNVLYHKSKTDLQSTLASSFWMAIAIGCVQLILTVLLIASNSLLNIIGIDSILFNEYQLNVSMFILMLSWFLSGSFGGILHKLMIPAGLYYESQWWNILYRFCQFVTIILTAMLGGSILSAAIFFAIVQIIVYFATFIYIKKHIPEFYPWWNKSDKKLAFSNFGKSFVLTINNIAQQVSNSGIIIFISNIISTIVVPTFTTIKTLTNTVGSISNILISSILPEIARYHAKREFDKINIVFNSQWFFSGAIINIAIVMVIPFIESIYIYWTKDMLKFDFTLFITLAASMSLINFGSGYLFYLTSINSLISQTTITIVRGIIIFTGGYFLVKPFGLVGIGLAILLSEIICSVILPFFFVRFIMDKSSNIYNFGSFLLSLCPPILMLILTIISLNNIVINSTIWIPSITLMIIIYYLNWLILDKEIKMRFKKIITDFLH